MQANSANQVFGVSSDLVHSGNVTNYNESNNTFDSLSEPTHFHGEFANCMEMFASAAIVADYLDAHQGWFRRCANPMMADPLGENAYALTIGRFGSFGYEVEPKIGLDLLPAENGVYRIKTIDIPGYVPPGYQVDFNASLQLVEAGSGETVVTRVEWELDLNIQMQFPRFIQTLPKSLIQGTGDRLLTQIVRQVSKCLTHKVQEDFHSTMGVSLPKNRRHSLWG